MASTSVNGRHTALVNQVAQSILHGFDRHFALFQEITREARSRFENADWDGEERARQQRIDFYDQRVEEAVDYIRQNFDLDPLEKTLWQDIKRQYLWLLYDHQQPELAESFYNSVFCRLFDRSYYNNRHIFVRPGSAIDFLDIENPVIHSYYLGQGGLHALFTELLTAFQLKNTWQNLARDVALLQQTFAPLLDSQIKPEPSRQVQIINSLFFRNKAAYIVGRAMVGVEQTPFVIPLLLTEQKQLYVDTIIIDSDDIALIFSFTRAYFMVHCPVPAAVVSFLETLLPTRSRADIYTSIGFQKQGKTLFYREFLHHLSHSTDKLVVAPGIKGMVMTVFTLPSYPYVFKVIKDQFPPTKKIDRQTVKQRYQMVKMHDRVGRMADTLEFSHVAFPSERFSADLLTELKATIASSLTFERDQIIISHLYIERRMVPFNIYLDNADEDMLERGVRSYGNAIKEMMAANIFPGDMLLKNFGVTRHGRVVFYDYDEICPLEEINIRTIPRPGSAEEELSAEPWFYAGEDDFFPQQFHHFVANHPRAGARFLRLHPELLQAGYWKKIQDEIRNKCRHDVFPYKQEMRFCHRFPERYPDRP